MANGANKVILVGQIGQDPEIKQFDNGGKLATISLATNESYKDKNGNKVENTEWHRVEFSGNVAGVVEQYLKKGSTIYIEGKLKTDKWQDNNGNNKSITKIKANNMLMLNNE